MPQAVAVFVKLSHTISLRVVDVVAKDASHSLLPQPLRLQESGKSCSVEDIVAPHAKHTLSFAHEFLADDEKPGQSPSGEGCSAYSKCTPTRYHHRANGGNQAGRMGEIINISLMPANMSTETG